MNRSCIIINTIVICLCMIAMAVMPSQAKEIPFQPPDCGLNALFILLELNGHHVVLSKLREELPPQTSKGYSFQDLKNAAARLGYDLQGISLHTSSNLPRVPAIVFLSDQKNGHFIVTKPIENSKTLIQVFDAPSQPRIVNEDVLKKILIGLDEFFSCNQILTKTYFNHHISCARTNFSTSKGFSKTNYNFSKSSE